MSVVAKTGDGRDWLAELRGAQDIETFKDLVMEVAVAKPELRASVCELARKAGGEELEDWVARFFILSQPQPVKHNYGEKPSSIVCWPSGLRRPLLAQNPASALAANLNAVLASKAKAAAQKPAPKPEPEPEPEPASSAEPEAEPVPRRTMLPVVVLPPPLPPPPSPNWDDAIAAMNEQHAIIENVGGKAVIASWEPSSLDLERLMVVFQSKDSFLLRYSNRFVSMEVPDGRGGSHGIKAPLGQWWLGHRNRRQYRGVTFRPGGPEWSTSVLTSGRAGASSQRLAIGD
jgi:hypothetical protein